MSTRNRIKTVLTLAAVAMALLGSVAQAAVLVYEPFAYADGWLTGLGGALGTTGTWTAYDTLNGDWRIHQQGDTSGVNVATAPVVRNMFDGTVDNLPTSGGYVGLPGPLDLDPPRGEDEDFEIGRYMDGSIALDPSVTATFQSGTTTWFSYVAVRAWDRNMEVAQLQLATDPSPNESRPGLYKLTNSGSGIGAGGGPPRNDRFDIMPRYHSGGDSYSLMGTATGWQADEFTAPDETATMPWVASDDDGFGAANIIVGKIEWDADTGGEDIITVVRFLETDELTEAAFDALVALKPDLSSANWTANKPNLDQSLFDTLNFAGTKFFVDEIRIGTTYEDVTGGAPDPSAPDVDAGDDWITWSGQAVQLDPNVFNNDPCDPQSPLTYAWSADAVSMADDNLDITITPDVVDPADAKVLITKTDPTGDTTVVTLTLAVNNEGRVEPPVKDTMTIDVYDDACLAAKATGSVELDPTDLDENCITNFVDFAVMATAWLDDYTITEPIAQ